MLFTLRLQTPILPRGDVKDVALTTAVWRFLVARPHIGFSPEEGSGFSLNFKVS